MRIFKFYKDPDNRWYVDLPEWKGTKEDLEMISGADSMLEYMSEGENVVYACLSVDNFKGSDILKLKKIDDSVYGGAIYQMKKYRGIKISLDMWLCDVTSFVFGEFPKKIYIAKI